MLPRLGPAPSFEALAQATTRDVHPRSLLDELCRLGLARLDAATDTVALQGDAFVPSGDRVRMLGFLGDNVGDHLRAAVDNVLASGKPPHLEQALFAQGLSAASLESLRPLLREQWAALRAAVVPALEARIAADAAAGALHRDAVGGEPLARVRLGLYAYQETAAAAGASGDDQPGAGSAKAPPRRHARSAAPAPRASAEGRNTPRRQAPRRGEGQEAMTSLHDDDSSFHRTRRRVLRLALGGGAGAAALAACDRSPAAAAASAKAAPATPRGRSPASAR
ncbi:MAG: hypothetical protein U1F25_16495 [Rubrivivax sp.]